MNTEAYKTVMRLIGNYAAYTDDGDLGAAIQAGEACVKLCTDPDPADGELIDRAFDELRKLYVGEMEFWVEEAGKALAVISQKKAARSGGLNAGEQLMGISIVRVSIAGSSELLNEDMEKQNFREAERHLKRLISVCAEGISFLRLLEELKEKEAENDLR